MRRALLLAAALIVFALAGAALAPASLAGLAVERSTHGAATLVGADGTIWRGRATLVAGGTQMPVGWSADAWPLVRGQLRVRLEPPDGASTAPRGVIVIGRDSIELADVQIALPAAMFVASSRAFIRPTGDVTLTSRALAWTPPTASGEAEFVWRNAQLAVTGGGAIALGTVSATLAATGDRIGGPLVNDGGDVEVGGTVTLTAPAALEVVLTVRPRAGSGSTLARTLAVIATPDDGGWRIRWRGDMR